MLDLNDDIYLPDEILEELDDERDGLFDPEERPELDFNDPAVARSGVEELLSDIQSPDELFLIA
jgi:hypothetical protein